MKNKCCILKRKCLSGSSSSQICSLNSASLLLSAESRRPKPAMDYFICQNLEPSGSLGIDENPKNILQIQTCHTVLRKHILVVSSVENNDHFYVYVFTVLKELAQ